MPEFRNVLKNLAYKMLPNDFVDIMLHVRRHFYWKRINRIASRNNEAIIKALLKSNRPIKLELGSGRRSGMEDWTSLDLAKDADIRLDLSQPLPFPNNCVAKIYSSHLLEHFAYPKPMVDLLSECYRILKIGGIFSVAVPNARIYLEAYTSSDAFDYRKYCSYNVGLSFKAKIDFVNYMAYMGGAHYHLFDEYNLITILSEAGFKNVTRRNFDSALDLESRRFQSIYAEGTK